MCQQSTRQVRPLCCANQLRNLPKARSETAWVINVNHALRSDVDMVGRRHHTMVKQNCVSPVGVLNNRLPRLFRIYDNGSMVPIVKKTVESSFPKHRH